MFSQKCEDFCFNTFGLSVRSLSGASGQRTNRRRCTCAQVSFNLSQCPIFSFPICQSTIQVADKYCAIHYGKFNFVPADFFEIRSTAPLKSECRQPLASNQRANGNDEGS